VSARIPVNRVAQDSSIKRRWLWLAVFVGAWTALALVVSVETYIGQLNYDKPVSWALAIRRSFKEIYSCAFLSLGILWLCRRLHFAPNRRARWILTHLLGAVVFCVSQVALVSWLEAGEPSVQTGEILTFSYLFRMLSVHYAVVNFIVYWIFVLGHLGWQYYRAYGERERQAAALAAELVQARLQTLRMQLNPHFLFNTLNTISASCA
jgi:two-component system LytT family sensor kinase